MKVRTDPQGVQWCELSTAETKKIQDAASICRQLELVERHAESGKVAATAADDLLNVLTSRQPEVETGPAYTGKKKDPLA